MKILDRALEFVRARSSAWARLCLWIAGTGAGLAVLMPPIDRPGTMMEVAGLSVWMCAAFPIGFGLFFLGFGTDYRQEKRVITGLAGADADFTLRSARWPPFTASLAIFTALAFGLGFEPMAGVPWGAVAAAYAVVAGLLGGAGAARGASLGESALVVDRALFWRTVPLDELTAARVSDDGTRLILFTAGGPVSIAVTPARASEARALVDQLRRRCGERWVEPPVPPVDPAHWAVLDCRGEPVESWVARIRALARGDDYRAPTMTREELRRVLASPTTAAERRIGAAIALRALGPGEARGGAAQPAAAKLRVALDAVEEEQLDAGMIEAAVREDEAARREG